MKRNLDSFFKPANKKMKEENHEESFQDEKSKTMREKKGILLFAHGAGAPSSSEWMVQWAHMLEQFGFVHTFDYPFMKNGKKAPDNKIKLIEAHTSALREAIEAFTKENKLSEKDKQEIPIYLVGKSLGSRVSCMVAAKKEFNVMGVVCLGYPLKDQAERAQLLLDTPVPVMFVQGTKDSMCSIPELNKIREKMQPYTQLHQVETGDHSLQIGKRYAKQMNTNQDKSDEEVMAAIGLFLDHISSQIC